jgi:hypothetical protein
MLDVVVMVLQSDYIWVLQLSQDSQFAVFKSLISHHFLYCEGLTIAKTFGPIDHSESSLSHNVFQVIFWRSINLLMIVDFIESLRVR